MSPHHRCHVFRGAFLLFAVGCVFSAGLGGPFFFDDIGSIPANAHTATPWSFDAFSAPDQTTAAGRPLVAWTLALNRAWGGFDPWGYHAVNIAIHGLNALLLWAVLAMILCSPKRPPWLAQQGTHLAWLVALLWSLHPLQSEAVTYVIQRTELMGTAATLAALACALKSFASPRTGRWQVAAVSCCLAGVLCKETSVAIPLLVLVVHRATFAPSWRASLASAPRLYAGLAACWLPLAALVAAGPRSDSVGFSHGITAGEWLMTQAQVLPHYLGLAFWPEPLSMVYDWPIVRTLSEAWIPGLGVLTLLLATVVALNKAPLLGLPGAWVFLLLAPSSSVVPIWTEVAAERRMSLPLAAVIAVVVMASAALWRRWSGDRLVENGVAQPSRVAGLTALCLGLAAVSAGATHERSALYNDQVALWSHTVEHQSGSAMAHAQLGRSLFLQGRFRDAVASYEQSLVLDPSDSGAQINLGNCLLELGDIPGALACYDGALALAPGHAPAHQNKGLALARAGDKPGAMVCFRQALEVDDGFSDARANLASLLLGQGDFGEAAEHLEQLLNGDPAHPLGLRLFAQLQRRFAAGAGARP
ncbi:MAG: Tfp pilus assembly protein PilF [Pseudohongiellaceae bacterium]|jgi:Tfp pilus assembly protein PilF